MAETLPLFPLGTVLLPGASLPLHIFEPRYRQLVVDLMTGTLFGRTFGVVCIKHGWEVGADNVISRKAMENIGGRLTGETFVEERVGRPVLHVIFEITREDFLAGPLAR